MTTGRCLCGGIAFQIDGELAAIQVCYCRQCQRAQGTAMATNIPVQESAFRFTSGAELLAAYESSPGKQRSFCSRCGSPIFSKRVSLPGVLRIRAGALDEPLNAKISHHAYTAFKPSWWEIRDNLPKFDAGVVADVETNATVERN